MDSNNNTKTPGPSPLRVLSGLLSAKERYHQRAADPGGLFETKLLRGHLDSARASVSAAASEAGAIAREADDIERVLQHTLADGVVTPREARQIKREVADLNHLAVPHYLRLRRLS